MKAATLAAGVFLACLALLGSWTGWATATTAGALAGGEAWYIRSLPARRRTADLRHAGFFSAGLFASAVVLLPPYDSLADRSFAAHMLQHVVLIFVSAPLLTLGDPGVALARTIARPWRRPARPMLRTAFQLERRLEDPRLAFTVFSLGLWMWHIPALFNLADRVAVMHVAEHATFLVAGAAFVAPLFRRRLSLWILPFLFATAMEGTVLGALLTFGGASWYQPEGPGAAGLSQLADQQLGGALMCLAGGVVTLGFGSWAFLRWMGQQPPAAGIPVPEPREPELAR